MDITKLREELNKITSDNDIFTHAVKIETLCNQFGCSIRVLDEYDPRNNKTFNCFEYALGLHENVHISIRDSVWAYEAGINSQFMEYLMALGDLQEKDRSRMIDNDLVIYFLNSKIEHAGRWDNGRVTSKWGSGLLYKHEIFDTPANYGEPRYFEEIQPSVAKTRFLEYARGKGVPDAILAA